MGFEVRVENAYYGNVVALEKIGFTVETGEIVGILGANGAGKTTGLLAIMGSVPCKFKELILDGVDFSRLRTWELAQHGIGFCPDGAWCFKNLTVIENLRNVYVVGAKS